MEPIQEYNLRRLAEQDLELVLDWRNSEQVRANMFTDRIISFDEHRKWFQNLQQSGTAQTMVFEYLQKPYGIVNITQISQQNQTCYWGFYMGEPDRPKGLGTVMGYLAIEYIFNTLDMRKLYAEVLDFNTISQNYHEKLGFQQEGHLVEHVWKNGSYRDVFLNSLFRKRWTVLREPLRSSIWGGTESHE